MGNPATDWVSVTAYCVRKHRGPRSSVWADPRWGGSPARDRRIRIARLGVRQGQDSCLRKDLPLNRFGGSGFESFTDRFLLTKALKTHRQAQVAVGQRHARGGPNGEAGRSAWEADTLPAELLPLGRPQSSGPHSTGSTPGSSSRRLLQELAEALGDYRQYPEPQRAGASTTAGTQQSSTSRGAVIGSSSVMPRSCATQTWRWGGQLKTMDSLAESMR